MGKADEEPTGPGAVLIAKFDDWTVQGIVNNNPDWKEIDPAIDELLDDIEAGTYDDPAEFAALVRFLFQSVYIMGYKRGESK